MFLMWSPSISATGLEQAVVAPRELASSSTIPQFSGPFNPLLAETTNSASGNGIPSPSGFNSLTFILASTKSSLNSVIEAVVLFSLGGIELGNIEITLMGV